MENREPSSHHNNGEGEDQSGNSKNAQSQPRSNEALAPLSDDNDGPPPPRRLLPRKRKSTIKRLQALCPDMFDPSLIGLFTSAKPEAHEVELQFPPSDGDLTMDTYLALCHIQPGDTQTHAAIERHSVYHWLIFKTTSIQRLCKLGIRHGPAVLLKGGVHKAMKRLHQD
ncbi:hypothetical protein PTTG_28848 [Puccinia triticina 1-1 BBBD Race 1]|uniref:Uncharacterized protein n=1 Tax=Puccinia triticina (isolate 1-1 / race 1 (BBBD)) TaxID=630390 RepID=A0A180G8K3_PUCT1|nr:hypothetical protein PTTG_28848 [Puccinia triticina 1-1 BBBD Race 1]